MIAVVDLVGDNGCWLVPNTEENRCIISKELERQKRLREGVDIILVDEFQQPVPCKVVDGVTYLTNAAYDLETWLQEVGQPITSCSGEFFKAELVAIILSDYCFV